METAPKNDIFASSKAEFANLEIFIDNNKPSEKSKLLVEGVELKGVTDCSLEISANDNFNMITATITVIVKKLHTE